MYDSMTLPVEAMVATRRVLTAMQAKGQVTIPVSIRRKLGLKAGDLVAFVETDQGVLLSPQQVVGMEALNTIGHLLREQGVDMAGLVASGRDLRGDLITERYGLADDAQP